jgi:DnaJ-class molecular chaperone
VTATLAPLVKLVPCKTCGGTGGIWMSRHNDSVRMIETGQECLVCEGAGELEFPALCENCGEPAIVIQATLFLCELCARERREYALLDDEGLKCAPPFPR